jgi:hypothetical protein
MGVWHLISRCCFNEGRLTDTKQSDGDVQASAVMLVAYTHASVMDWNIEASDDSTGVWHLAMR